MEGKIFITVGMLENINTITEIIKSQYPEYIEDKKIMPIHSKQTEEENERAKKEGDIIISTIKSAGTGLDIHKLRAIINLDPFSSKVTAKQLMGRLREYSPDKYSFLFDLIDMGFKSCVKQYEKKKKVFETLAYKIQPMDVRY